MTELRKEFADQGQPAEKPSQGIYLVYSQQDEATKGSTRATVRGHEGEIRDVRFTDLYRTGNVLEWSSRDVTIVAVLASEADILTIHQEAKASAPKHIV